MCAPDDARPSGGDAAKTAAVKNLVWISRPEPDAGLFADRVAALGCTPLVAPLSEVIAVDVDTRAVTAAIRAADVVAVTSRNALRFVSDAEPVRRALADARVACVGAATAEAAREIGCCHVVAAGGTVDELIGALIHHRAQGASAATAQTIVYLRGEDVSRDLRAAILAARPKWTVAEQVVYRMQWTALLPAPVRVALQSKSLGAVTLFSPAAAQHYAALVAEAGDTIAVQHLPHVCMSDRVAQKLAHLQLTDLRTALKPTADEMLESLIRGSHQ